MHSVFQIQWPCIISWLRNIRYYNSNSFWYFLKDSILYSNRATWHIINSRLGISTEDKTYLYYYTANNRYIEKVDTNKIKIQIQIMIQNVQQISVEPHLYAWRNYELIWFVKLPFLFYNNGYVWHLLKIHNEM